MTMRVEQFAQLVAPNGDKVDVPVSVFTAIRDMTAQRKTGAVRLEFRDGGVAGVKVEFAYK